MEINYFVSCLECDVQNLKNYFWAKATAYESSQNFHIIINTWWPNLIFFILLYNFFLIRSQTSVDLDDSKIIYRIFWKEFPPMLYWNHVRFREMIAVHLTCGTAFKLNIWQYCIRWFSLANIFWHNQLQNGQ